MHKLSDLDNGSKDDDYRDHGNNEADDDSAMDLGGKGTGGKLRKRAAAMIFHYLDDDYDHLYERAQPPKAHYAFLAKKKPHQKTQVFTPFAANGNTATILEICSTVSTT